MDEYEVQTHWFEQASDVLRSECLDFRSDGLKMDGWTPVSSPDEYISRHFKRDIPEIKTEPFSTFEVDWVKLRKAVDELNDVCPDQFEDFQATFRSGEWPDHDFWSMFVTPLKDYLEMTGEVQDADEIEAYYRDLKDCLGELRDVVRRNTE